MASAQIALPVLALLVALYLLPPAISLVAALRRGADLRRRGQRRSAWIRAGAGLAALALGINAGIVAALLRAAADGSALPGRLHLLAALLAWASLWLWIALAVLVRRRRMRG